MLLSAGFLHGAGLREKLAGVAGSCWSRGGTSGMAEKNQAKPRSRGGPSAACRFHQRSYKTCGLAEMGNCDFGVLPYFHVFLARQTGNFYTNIWILEKLRTNLLSPPLTQPFFISEFAGNSQGMERFYFINPAGCSIIACVMQKKQSKGDETMLLAFDVGNTNIVLGVFQDGELIQNWRLETDNNKSADEYGMVINQLFQYEGLNVKEVEDVIISTVVPSVLFTLQHLSMKYFNKRAIVIGPGIKTGLIVKYDNPKQVGADRIVNAVAAHAKYGGPLIIIDFGTATTFCAISEKAEYLGGTIGPGLKISSEALFEKTAKLPKVELEEPGNVICRNTIHSMQSGLVYGHMGMVDYIVKKMKKELQEYSETEEPVKVIATGGLATLIDNGIDCIDHVDKLLTLEGLELIYRKNKRKR